ncbi:MAG: nucleotidyltransferase domain-containing protein [Candidatus Sumerlaeota bacterium]|nr:nucleotidyltransferase domain-containing protein [Candidatus Sumerlaeota bacterium]
MIDEIMAHKVVKCILSIVQPVRIILFGSAASGAMTRDSDLDLLIILRKVTDPREEGIRLRAALTDLNVPVDVIILSYERFEETKDIIGGIAYPAHKYGRVIYETA